MMVTVELTAAPITEPAMPILDASSMDVAAAAALARIWGTEMPSSSRSCFMMGCVLPIDAFSRGRVYTLPRSTTRVRC